MTAWWVLILLCIDGAGPSNNLGRFDQYMYPFYKADVDAGLIDEDLAREMIEELYIKSANILQLYPTKLAFFANGYYRYQQLDLGGLDKQGKDASNPVSYLALQAMREVHTNAPSVSVLLHQKTPDDLLYEAVMLSAQGMGHPSFFNVETMWQMLMGRARPDFTVPAGSHWMKSGNLGWMVGCVEPGVQGRQYGHTDSALFNLCGILTLTLNNGVKPTGMPGYASGEQFGPATGDPRNFKTFEEFFDAFKQQLVYCLKESQLEMAVGERLRSEEHFKPMYTILTHGTIERGLDVEQGGAPVSVGPVTAVMGTADVANSLFNIKTLVYENKEITMDELCKALDADFEGYESLRQQLRNSPKYGNDLDGPDFLARDVLDFYATETKKLKTYAGHYMDPSIQMVQVNVVFGSINCAQPNGKKAGESMADTISAEQQTDEEGPTAAIKTYGKLDHAGQTNGTILNMWISKSEMVSG